MDIRRAPLRSTFLNGMISYCPRRALLEVIGDPYPRPHYMMGGSVISLIMEMYHRGGCRSDEPMVVAIQGYLATARGEPGGYNVNEEQQKLIIQRTAEIFEGAREWFDGWDGEVVAAEVEIRSTSEAGSDIAIKPDMLARTPSGLALLDGKAMGVYTKSIAPPVYKEADLRQVLQLSLYAYVLQRGGVVYNNLPKETRNWTNAEVAAKFESTPLKLDIKSIGLFQYGMVTRRKRDGKYGKAGEYRGNPLRVIDYDESCADYAREAIDFVEHCIAFGQFPRAARREQGKSSCASCAFHSACWSGRVDQSAESIPDFLLEK